MHFGIERVGGQDRGSIVGVGAFRVVGKVGIDRAARRRADFNRCCIGIVGAVDVGRTVVALRCEGYAVLSVLRRGLVGLLVIIVCALGSRGGSVSVFAGAGRVGGVGGVGRLSSVGFCCLCRGRSLLGRGLVRLRDGLIPPVFAIGRRVRACVRLSLFLRSGSNVLRECVRDVHAERLPREQRGHEQHERALEMELYLARVHRSSLQHLRAR